eukprot:COSAG05_NODE_16719_length_340_cov_0.829876_1_plen_25_part_10
MVCVRVYVICVEDLCLVCIGTAASS